MKMPLLLGLTGAAALAWDQVAATDLNEHNVRGPRDVTVLIGGMPPAKPPLPPPCTIIAWAQPYAKVMVFGGAKAVSLKGSCTWDDIKHWEEKVARAVRERLGDPGRH